MLRSETIAQVAAALAAAQGCFPSIPKSRTVTVQPKPKRKADGTEYWPTAYHYSYAPLDTILDAVRPHLAANGLALVQGVVQDDKGAEYVRTTLLHSSGEWIAHDQPLFAGVADNASQGYASGMTYSRRYGVQALLCLAADDDNDGGTDDDERERSTGRGAHGRQPQGRAPSKPQAPRQPREREQPAPAVKAEDVAQRASGEAEGFVGLSESMERLLLAKGKAVGLDAAGIVARFGTVSPANINTVLSQLKPAPAEVE